MKYLIPFLISALMGMGVGGGGLLIIYLSLFLSLSQVVAQGTNLFLFIVAGLCSLIIHFRKRKINPRLAILGAFLGGIGSYLSSHALSSVDPRYAKICLGVLLIISGFFSLYNALIKKDD